MRTLAFGLLVVLLLVGCSSEQGPIDTPTLAIDLVTLPLPPGVSGIPEAGAPTTMIEPISPAGSIPIGAPQNYQLGHCGLGSPIDFDGSLWDPTAGDNGAGGDLTQDQHGELINATPVVLTLVDATRTQMVTPCGARILLVRHAGARPYYLCD